MESSGHPLGLMLEVIKLLSIKVSLYMLLVWLEFGQRLLEMRSLFLRH